MSFPELNSVFTWCSPTLPTGLLLITDVLEADGSFLLHHFITAYVKGGCHTTIVGLENGFSHYFSIGRKLVFHPHVALAPSCCQCVCEGRVL